MILHIEPKQIRKLTRNMLDTMSILEENSIQNGGEAEVYFVGKVREDGKSTYINYYAILEKYKNDGSTNDYFVGVYNDRSKDMLAFLAQGKTREEVVDKLPERIEHYKEKYLENSRTK